MKNLLSLLITLGFIFGIAACEPKPATDETEDTETLDETEEEIDEETEEYE
jgi:hypothetical protein